METHGLWYDCLGTFMPVHWDEKIPSIVKLSEKNKEWVPALIVVWRALLDGCQISFIIKLNGLWLKHQLLWIVSGSGSTNGHPSWEPICNNCCVHRWGQFRWCLPPCRSCREVFELQSVRIVLGQWNWHSLQTHLPLSPASQFYRITRIGHRQQLLSLWWNTLNEFSGRDLLWWRPIS